MRGMSVIGGKAPVTENDAPKSTEQLTDVEIAKAAKPASTPDALALTNGHDAKTSESVSEEVKQASDEGRNLREGETQEVSDAAPKEDAQNAEANLADSETKDEGEGGSDAEEVNAATEESIPHEMDHRIESSRGEPVGFNLPNEGIAPSSSSKEPTITDSANADAPSDPENTLNGVTLSLESQPVQENAPDEELKIETEAGADSISC